MYTPEVPRRRCDGQLWILPMLLLLVSVHVAACAIIPLSSGSGAYMTVDNATDDGAVCLDGSPPAYYMLPGFGNGTKNWIVYIEGGGLYTGNTDCADRATGFLGSTSLFSLGLPFVGFQSNNSNVNPGFRKGDPEEIRSDFYNWNMVRVRYCDGAFFMGNREEPVVVPGPISALNEEGICAGRKKQASRFYTTRPQTLSRPIYYRWERVWNAVMEDLLNRGMDSAEKAVLTGCSAGGLTAILHCDRFSRLLSANATIKCVPDSGFLLDIQDIAGRNTSRTLCQAVAELHNVTGALDKNCTAGRTKSSEWECIFAQYLLPHIQTPIYFVQSGYDWWQVQNLLIPPAVDPTGTWTACKYDIRNCNQTQLAPIQELRNSMIQALKPLKPSKDGEFIISCYAHCFWETYLDETIWNGHLLYLINNKTLAHYIGDWFYNRHSASQTVDIPFPLNPTCG